MKDKRTAPVQKFIPFHALGFRGEYYALTNYEVLGCHSLKNFIICLALSTNIFMYDLNLLGKSLRKIRNNNDLGNEPCRTLLPHLKKHLKNVFYSLPVI